MWGSVDRAVNLLGRNIPSVLRMTTGVYLKTSRQWLCIKPQEETKLQPKSKTFCLKDSDENSESNLCGQLGFFIPRGGPILRVPGYKPTDWEKRFLLWAGHFKKPEDIPETVSIETVRAAKTTLRVKFSYVMMALTIVGCITMVIKGKQAVKRHETLTSINLEKKAQWREEASQSASAKP